MNFEKPGVNPAIEKLFRTRCPSGPFSSETDAFFPNTLQLALWIKIHGEAPKGTDSQEILQRFGPSFRAAFNEMIEKDPEYFSGYASVGEIPEEKWDEVQMRMGSIEQAA